MRLKDKVILVTASTRGIGLAIVKKCAAEGARVYMAARDMERAKEIANALHGVKCVYNDATKPETFSTMVEDVVRDTGRIDVLVNNAGGSAGLLGKLTRFVDAEPETLDFVIDTNLKGAMHCAQAVLPGMIEKKYGKIINISSIAAVVGLVDRVDYSAAKAAMIGMSKALAMEVGEYNICVNCVSPGAIWREGHAPFEHMTHLGETGHGGQPSDIADAVLFLAEQDYITGENLVVDGGRTLGASHR